MTKKLNVCVFTSTRAEYGLLYNLIKLFEEDDDITQHILVTGTHLSKKFGYTANIIKKDNWKNVHLLKSLGNEDNYVSLSNSVGDCIKKLSKCLSELRPDCMVLLGDRFELFAPLTVCTIMNIPIAHISGGELTEGAIDNQVRHAITKSSHLHFVSNETFAKRLIQMGEEKWRVQISGELGLDNIKKLDLMHISEINNIIKLDINNDTAIVTYHPATLELKGLQKKIKNILYVLNEFDLQYVFTYPNTDPGHEIIIKEIKKFVKNHSSSVFIKSLGQKLYLNLMQHAKVMIGNSSSGFFEAPSYNLPVINIGSRQKSRLQSNNIINCDYNKKSLYEAINKGIYYKKKKLPNPYGNGNSSNFVIKKLKRIFLNTDKSYMLNKKFTDRN